MNFDFRSTTNNIIGNIAIANIASGVSVGLAVSVFRIIQSKSYLGVIETIKDVFETIATLIFFSSVIGLMLVAPSLTLLNRFKLSGPSSVHLICFLLFLALFSVDILTMVLFQILLLVNAYIFCKQAYQEA